MWQTRHSMGDGVRPLVNHPVRGVDNSYSGGHRPRGGSFSFPFPIACRILWTLPICGMGGAEFTVENSDHADHPRAFRRCDPVPPP